MSNSTTTPATCPLMDVKAVAKLIGCSPRHVYRMVDLAHIPSPLRIGRLVRWSQSRIAEWVSDGCPKQNNRRTASKTSTSSSS